MAEDAEDSRRKLQAQRSTETFQRAPETRAEHRFPARLSGIVAVPPGSRGPRSLYLKRYGDSFGFTLRHFIVYPPESIADCDPRRDPYGNATAPSGAGSGSSGAGSGGGEVLQPMETIFVRQIAERGPAAAAGLQPGDQILSVNGLSVRDIRSENKYHEVVQIIKNAPEYLHLLVVPKEEDIIQKYYVHAHHPTSNQHTRQQLQQLQLLQEQQLQQLFYQDHLATLAARRRQSFNPQQLSLLRTGTIDQQQQQQQLQQQQLQQQLQLQQRHQHQQPVGARNGGNLANGGSQQHFHHHPLYGPTRPLVQQKSADHIYSEPAQLTQLQRSPHPNSRLLQTAGFRQQRSLESCLDGGFDEVAAPGAGNIGAAAGARAQPQEPSALVLRRQTTMGRRPSAGNYSDRDSSTDYCSIASEEMMKSSTDNMLVYPNAPGCRRSLDAAGNRRRESTSSISSSLTDASKHSLGSFDSSSTLTDRQDMDDNARAKLKQRIQEREDFLKGSGNGGLYYDDEVRQKEYYGRVKKLEQKQVWPPPNVDLDENQHNSPSRHNKPTHQNLQRVQTDIDLERDLHEQKKNGKFVSHLDKINEKQNNDCNKSEEDRRWNYQQPTQIVQRRARAFEAGQSSDDRTSFFTSELHRLSNKHAVPNVMDRTKEFESLSGSPPPQQVPTSPPVPGAAHEPRRDASWSSTGSSGAGGGGRRGAMQQHQAQVHHHRDSRSLDSSDSNTSIASLAEARDKKLSGNLLTPIGSKFIHCPAPADYKTAKDFSFVDNEFSSYRARSNSADSWKAPPSYSNTVGSDKPLVVRRTKNTNITDEDRIMRRESYLKATEGGRLNFEYELSDGEVSPQVLRSAHRRWRPPLFASDIQQLRKLFEDAATSLGGSISGNSSSSVSLEREKGAGTPLSEQHRHQIVKEGQLTCKFTEFDGKRSGDRSWKQYWATLRGPRLYLYKDRHHQSPVGSAEAHLHSAASASAASAAAAAEQSLAAEIGVRGGMVQVAADYTKRKHVLRLRPVQPCSQELLLQAEGAAELQCWVRALQEQAAGQGAGQGAAVGLVLQDDDNDVSAHKQPADPQADPAKQPKAAPLQQPPPPQRNRSPTGLSPASKTRKPSTSGFAPGAVGAGAPGGYPAAAGEPATSPKLKTWRGRVAHKFRKMQGASSPNSPIAPEGSTFGVPLEHCLPSHHNQNVPRLVEVCTEIVEAKALETIGIYRVPGKKADVTALTDEVNRNYDEVPQIDPRWNDVHVVSSLLKSFFRKIPESLLTNELYPDFIKANKLLSPEDRMQHIRSLLRQLPQTHYYTLRHLVLHLRQIVDHAGANKMEAKNLAIVFGPTIVRSEDNMQTMVNDMTHQCKIVETLLTYADWFFSDDDVESLHLPAPIASAEIFQTDPEGIRADLLRDTNINKIEGLHQTKEQKEKHRVIQTILSAAMKKKKKSNATPSDFRPEARISNGQTDFSQIQSYTNITYDLKEGTTEHNTNTIPTTVSDIENFPPQQQQQQQQPKSPGKGYFNYKKDGDQYKKRIEDFIQETESNLTRPRGADISSNASLDTRLPNPHSYSAGNISIPHNIAPLNASPLAGNPRLSLTSTLPSSTGGGSRQPITKTNSASNVFAHQQQQQQQQQQRHLQFTTVPIPYNSSSSSGSSVHSAGAGVAQLVEYGGLRAVVGVLRRGSSVENMTVGAGGGGDVGGAGMKKLRYETEVDAIQRSGSLDSINKFSTGEDGDLVATITKIFDEKKKEFTLSGEDLPFVDESPEKSSKSFSTSLKTPSIPNSPILYRNPSLHKNQYGSKLSQSNKETIEQTEKDVDSTIGKPNNERYLPSNTLTPSKKILTLNLNAGANGKLKRSESLNKPERTASPLHSKLKRSESLNKPGERLKRSDSLTKTEKTESNISKRREMNHSTRRTNKDCTKLKRKNGMPERSIKRRHTVGGTKDPDKVNYLDNRQQAKLSDNKENNAEKKGLRTSSPDLSGCRRPASEQRLLLEVSVMGPDVVVALRQHLVGARPVSFPETVFSVPLESHV